VHGVIFASVADYITARHGPEAAAALLEAEPSYLLSETYPDEQLVALVVRAAEHTGLKVSELLREIGSFTAAQTFARLYPAQFAIAGGTRQFLLGVETHIHELVRATLPSARPPQLTVTEDGPDAVTIDYSSPRRLCHLLIGLTEGTAEYYGEEVVLDEVQCMHRGDPACRFRVVVTPAPRAA
jgi:Haem-NO-binding